MHDAHRALISTTRVLYEVPQVAVEFLIEAPNKEARRRTAPDMGPSLADAGKVPGDFWLNVTAWGEFFYGRRSHFYAGKMREVSGIDPAGMLWVIGFNS